MKLNREQVRILDTLRHWIRNKHFYSHDEKEVRMSDDSIKYWIEQADKKSIPFHIQNVVLAIANNEDIHSDILDILAKNNIEKDY
jgi:hypothetical protein